MTVPGGGTWKTRWQTQPKSAPGGIAAALGRRVKKVHVVIPTKSPRSVQGCGERIPLEAATADACWGGHHWYSQQKRLSSSGDSVGITVMP